VIRAGLHWNSPVEVECRAAAPRHQGSRAAPRWSSTGTPTGNDSRARNAGVRRRHGGAGGKSRRGHGPVNGTSAGSGTRRGACRSSFRRRRVSDWFARLDEAQPGSGLGGPVEHRPADPFGAGATGARTGGASMTALARLHAGMALPPCVRHVAELMPCRRQSSSTLAAASCSFSTPMIFSSLNRPRFMGRPPVSSMTGGFHSQRSGFRALGRLSCHSIHRHCVVSRARALHAARAFTAGMLASEDIRRTVRVIQFLRGVAVVDRPPRVYDTLSVDHWRVHGAVPPSGRMMLNGSRSLLSSPVFSAPGGSVPLTSNLSSSLSSAPYVLRWGQALCVPQDHGS
jgi:hypothetical protein